MSDTYSTPQHPFTSGLGIDCTSGQRDALNNCVSVLSMLADLFGSDATDFQTLDSAAARRGMWITLVGVADLLAAVSNALGGE